MVFLPLTHEGRLFLWHITCLGLTPFINIDIGQLITLAFTLYHLLSF